MSPMLEHIKNDLNHGRTADDELVTVADVLTLAGIVAFCAALLFAGPIMLWITGAA